MFRSIPLGLLAVFLAGCISVSSNLRQRSDALRMAHVQEGALVAARRVQLDGPQTGLGAGAGAVVGSVAGSSVGGYRESAVFATLGAVLGGVIGHAIERSGGRENALELIVQLRNGERVAIVQREGDEKFAPGDAVMVVTSGRSARVTRALPPVPLEAAQPQASSPSR